MEILPNYKHRFSFRGSILLPFFVVLIFLSGCSSKYVDATVEFRDTVERTSGVVGNFFSELNKFERDLYIESAKYDPAMVVAWQNNTKPTALAGSTFDGESVKARMDAIRLIGAYAGLLAETASSEGPANFKESTGTLGGSLKGLAETFEGLAGTDPTASLYIQPIAKLIGAIGEMILAQRRDQAIEVAVRDGAPAVRIMLAQLKKDAELVITSQRTTGLKQSLAEKIKFYNDNRGTLSFEQRGLILDEINHTARAYDNFIDTDPTSLLTSLENAHEKLVTFVGNRSDKNAYSLLRAANSTRENLRQIEERMSDNAYKN